MPPPVSGIGEGRPAGISVAETSPETAVLSGGAECSWASFSMFCSMIWAVVRVSSVDTNVLISLEERSEFISGFLLIQRIICIQRAD
ncbi:hypothetical protein ACK6D9_22455 (plasmid) [Hoeflea sp. Naph1]|uniref:hypothetical protein n=1 Tax=Hoeflea sp. Naph1 TaxID=3388653 RepID=UPI00398FDE6F